MSDLAKKVINARRGLGLSQQEAADLIGVSLSELQQVEAQAIVDGTGFTIGCELATEGAMKNIKCQAKHSESGGCHYCGGSGVVLERIECKCGKSGFFRNLRGTTVYDGKEMTSFDGLGMVWHLDGIVCLECEERSET